MPDPRGFLRYERREPAKEPVAERVKHHREFERSLPLAEVGEQATRCMGCGVPFCHTGCPLGNLIPDWNDLVRTDRWDEALSALESTNDFPEITGRICPAPCEASCVVGINGPPVAIKAIERAIADRALADIEAGVREAPPLTGQRAATGRRVAVVGSGPAGLACAIELARAGHSVTVFEKDDRPGGLLRYGIPDFKLEKALVDARIEQMKGYGILFEVSVEVGTTISLDALNARFDAIVFAIGATLPRDLPIEGREQSGIHFAMDYLIDANRRVAGDAPAPAPISADGKRVVILGGGDTGSDCLGTAIRQGAASVLQIELLPRAPDARASETPWPLWPFVHRTSSSQEEGGDRDFAVLTQRFVGAEGRVTGLEVVRVDWQGRAFSERPDSRFVIEADLVLLALGFTGADRRAWNHDALVTTMKSFATDRPGMFVCGDARRGQSLVVWAIWEGREAARAVDQFLVGETHLASSPYVYAP